MLSVRLCPRAGYLFYFALSGEGASGGCGMTEEGALVREGGQYGELLLRAAVNKCMRDGLSVARTEDVWDADLSRFGFERADGAFRAAADALRLPHDCGA